ncbi:MAG TPA: hypothetical protein VGG89_13775 [Candidatus Baltobacteraceae bacterium]
MIPAAAAMAVLLRANALCAADNGRLWGVSLCVPIMLADPNTLQAVANRDVAGATRDGKLFGLTLPAGTQVANAPFTYAGRHWAQIQWPMFGDADTQAVTLMHESFHIVQPKLGFNGNADTGSISGDEFLDTKPGRIWLRGELHALRAALQSSGEARTQALRDALTMRLYRHMLSATTGSRERQLDVLEGLAEGTGIDAGLPPNRRIRYALYDMTFVEKQPSYARAFAYATGPAYTELLDAARSDWRRGITPASDVALLTMRDYGLDVETLSAVQAQAALARYGGKAIEAQEAARAARKAALDKTYTRELVEGATLSLPLVKFHIRFDPRDIETLDRFGTVYHTVSVAAPWGSLDVTGGNALVTTDFKTVRVAVPNLPGGRVIGGTGWRLKLAPGYRIVADPRRSGSYTVLK